MKRDYLNDNHDNNYDHDGSNGDRYSGNNVN